MAEMNEGQLFEEFLKWYTPQRGKKPKDIVEWHKNMRGNFENWKTQKKVDDRYEEITNFDSPYYQEYRKFLQDSTPQLGVNSLISPLLAGGAGYSGAQKIAQERSQAFTQQRQQGINQGVREFALNSQTQGNSLLGMSVQNSQFMQQLAEQKRQFDESQPTFFDSLLNIGGGLLGNFVGGLGGSNKASGYGNTGGGTSTAMKYNPYG